MLQEHAFLEVYKELAELCFEDLKANKLVCIPHFVGKLYGNSPFKLMVVGRAVGKWDEDYSICDNAEDMAKKVIAYHDSYSISRVVDRGDGSKDFYVYRENSALWRLINNYLAAVGEATPDLWYDDPLNWQEKIVATNLYKLSPMNGMNPGQRLQKKIYRQCVKLLKLELETYKPTHILFITGDDWVYYDKWPGYFAEALGIEKLSKSEQSIVGRGRLGSAKYVVCVRPECKKEDNVCEAVVNAFAELE